MRLFVSGSAPLLAETHREWSARTGHAMLERYGMTETNMNTSNPYDGERVPGAVGLPLPGVSVRVTDPETGKDLGRETIGMIEVKGPNVFKGYWRMPEKTKAEFRDDGFFITGDLGKIDEQGLCPHPRPRQGSRHLRRLQRLSEGNRERDRRHARRGGIRRDRRAACRFRRRRHRRGGAPARAPVDEAAVLKALEGRLAKFKMPKRVFFVDDLPRNTMGKVQKNVLRDTYANIYAK